MSVIAADNRGAVSHSEIDWTRPSLLILGSEAHGLSDDKLSMTDSRARIDTEGEVESLNLAVSAGVMLFEARRQTHCRADANKTVG